MSIGHQACAEALQQAEEQEDAAKPDGSLNLYALAAQGRHDELKQELERVRQTAAGREGSGAQAGKKAVAEALHQVRVGMVWYDKTGSIRSLTRRPAFFTYTHICRCGSTRRSRCCTRRRAARRRAPRS